MNPAPMQLNLDRILQDKAPKLYRKMPRFILNYLKKKIHLNELNNILRIYADKDGVDFTNSVIDYFDLKLEVEGFENLSPDEVFVFASNHPLGGLDGICLTSVIGNKYDKKIKYLVNDFLLYIKNLQSVFIPVNKHGGQSKKAAALITEAYMSDNQIITFPAGLCSRKQEGQICDSEWKKNFIQKAIETKRDVVPVYFEGKNSNFFYRFANLRKSIGLKFNLEMIFLPDEMFKNKGKTFKIILGEPIPYSFFDQSKSAFEWAQYVKQEAYKLNK